MTRTILVTGATGNVGAEVVNALASSTVGVRALIRSTENPALPANAEPVTGDLADPATLTAALTGVDALFLLPGFPGAAEAAREAGVRRIVQLSGGSAANDDLTNAVTAYMAASEAELRATGLEHTVIRPAAFMANALRWLPQLRRGDTVSLQFPKVSTAYVDPADIGAVAARALLTDEWLGRVLVPTGPAALRPADLVATLADVLGRDLEAVPLTDEETRAQMEQDGTPQRYIDAFFDFYAAGSLDESKVLPTVEQVTGRPPRTFRQWAEAHAESFA
jgi:uncharacterized protein YbjT (DUF2867 family)